jgi:hypothetical protein
MAGLAPALHVFGAPKCEQEGGGGKTLFLQPLLPAIRANTI